MAKIKKMSGDAYIEKAKKRRGEELSANFTFRFNVQMMSAFKGICEENDLTMTELLREFIEDVIRKNQSSK